MIEGKALTARSGRRGVFTPLRPLLPPSLSEEIPAPRHFPAIKPFSFWGVKGVKTPVQRGIRVLAPFTRRKEKPRSASSANSLLIVSGSAGIVAGGLMLERAVA